MSPALSIIRDNDPKAPKVETVAERIRRLQAEAKALAQDHVLALLASIEQTTAIAREIADGGAAYHDGAQERARQIAMELESQRTTLQQIVERAS